MDRRHRTSLIAAPVAVLALACVWLQSQLPAPRIDESGSYSMDRLMARYLRETAHPGMLGLSTMGKHTVVVGAWEYLCRATREDRMAPVSDEDD
jgi:hypothetical protein